MKRRRIHLLILWCIVAALWPAMGGLYAQNQSETYPLSKIIPQIEAETGYRFLYREALISGITIPYSGYSGDNQTPIESLNDLLASRGLAIRVDSTYKQAVLIKLSETVPANHATISVSGHVVDRNTGERLPFASITWSHDGETNGVSANESGRYQVKFEAERETLTLRCSYVGYEPETVQLDAGRETDSIKEVTFRLQPQRIDASELIVTGTNYYDQINEHASGLVDISTFSPLGSSNSVRALQSLPSVSLSPALKGEMHVRGSPEDGFRVLLDGVTIFNQSHLFGMLDSFNADVLQRSGFYYDIAPAQYQAPPGGTLSMITQTGGLNEFSATAGASNTSYRLTLQGPLQQGKSSWMLSGRSSYLNSMDWLNNSNLIQWGLNVDRPREILEENLVNIETELERSGQANASFFDFHGKFYLEGRDGSRFILSGYYGGDRTLQQGERLYRRFRPNGPNLAFQAVETENNWSNGAGSIQYQHTLSEQAFMHSTVGISVYNSEFRKDDFSYKQINRDNNTFQLFTFPFENRSILTKLKAKQQFDVDLAPFFLTTGLTYNYYLGEYYEDSFDKPGFFTSRRSHKLDLYAQLDVSPLNGVNVSSGSRLHYFSNGDYLRWSPRVKVKIDPEAPVSLGAGYSRNFQFLNKISLSNTVTSDVWVLTNAQNPPTEVNYVSAGIYLDPVSWIYAQIEGYHKDYRYLRLHEINALSLTNPFGNAPWYTNNSGSGRGIEFLVRNQYGPLGLTQTFTVSEMVLSNPDINNGGSFYADWDRTYRYGARLEVEAVDNFFLYLAWNYATGTPNRLAVFGAANDERLGNYQRTDVTLEYKNSLSFGRLNTSLSVFNLFDRSNPWYRDLTFVLDQGSSSSRFRTVPVDVYDLGFQPSFNVSVSF